MKKLNSFFSFLSLLVFFLASGGTSYGASTTESLSDTSSEEVFTFNPDRNTKSVFVEEISFSKNLQTNPEEEFSSFPFSFNPLQPNCFNSNSKLFPNDLSNLQDKRKLLGQTIFPYHFFW